MLIKHLIWYGQTFGEAELAKLMYVVAMVSQQKGDKT